jgi:hypothetical protein
VSRGRGAFDDSRGAQHTSAYGDISHSIDQDEIACSAIAAVVIEADRRIYRNLNEADFVQAEARCGIAF